MKKWLMLGLVVGSTLNGLETEPWLPQPYQPHVFLSYDYSTYTRVANATRQIRGRSHDQRVNAGLGLATLTYWGFDGDVEFARTPRFSWGLRSVGAQIRKQLFNDIEGDFASFTPGLAVRVVPSKAIEDVSTPYHYHFNAEINASVGKEWSYDIYWRGRIYNQVGIGIANRGSAWIRDEFALGLNREDQFQFQAALSYYRGFGDQVGVNASTSVFNGWKNIDHRSLDLAVSFCYLTSFWGSFTLEVKRRLYARSYPEKVTFLLLRYDLPLSL